MQAEAVIAKTPSALRRSTSVVTSILLALACFLIAACTSKSPNEPPADNARIIVSQPGAEFRLLLGGSADVQAANLRVGFDSVLSDSRCPTKALVQCVWAGSVIVSLNVGPINGEAPTRQVKLETVAGRDAATVYGHVIRFVSVLPEKEFLEPIPPRSYVIVLTVDGPPK